MRTVDGPHIIEPGDHLNDDLTIKVPPGKDGLVLSPECDWVDLDRTITITPKDNRRPGRYGAILRGGGVSANKISVDGMDRSGILIHEGVPATFDIDITEFRVSRCGWGGVHGQGPIRSMYVGRGHVSDINHDGGTSADAITAYDARNGSIVVQNVTVDGVKDHHAVHIFGRTRAHVENVDVLHTVDRKHAAVYLGPPPDSTLPDGLQGVVGRGGAAVRCHAHGGGEPGSRAVWIRRMHGTQIVGGTYTGFYNPIFVEDCKHTVVDGGTVLHPSSHYAIRTVNSENTLVGTVVADRDRLLLPQ